MFSLVIVVKNNVLGLIKTLESITSQSVSQDKVQIVVIDGNSQDGTVEFCWKSKQIDTFISEDDTGIYNAMNKGIGIAKMDWVIFLNTGDSFYHNKVLEELDNFIVTHTHCSYVCGHTIENFHGQEKMRTSQDISLLPVHMPACHQSMCMRRDILTQYPFNEEFMVCADLYQVSSLVHDGMIPCYFDGIIAEVEGLGYSNLYWKRFIEEREIIQRRFYNSRAHKIKLTRYHNTMKIKKFIRAFIPLKIQLLIRKRIR